MHKHIFMLPDSIYQNTFFKKPKDPKSYHDYTVMG